MCNRARDRTCKCLADARRALHPEAPPWTQAKGHVENFDLISLPTENAQHVCVPIACFRRPALSIVLLLVRQSLKTSEASPVEQILRYPFLSILHTQEVRTGVMLGILISKSCL